MLIAIGILANGVFAGSEIAAAFRPWRSNARGFSMAPEPPSRLSGSVTFDLGCINDYKRDDVTLGTTVTLQIEFPVTSHPWNLVDQGSGRAYSR